MNSQDTLHRLDAGEQTERGKPQGCLTGRRLHGDQAGILVPFSEIVRSSLPENCQVGPVGQRVADDPKFRLLDGNEAMPESGSQPSEPENACIPAENDNRGTGRVV